MADFPFDMFKRDPAMDRRIMDSNFPSDFFPKRGEYFRIRSATVADRSWMGCIWLCIESQDHCAVGKRVLSSYGKSDLGEIKSFVAGDVIFYDCTKIWAAVEEGRGAPADPTAGASGEVVTS